MANFEFGPKPFTGGLSTGFWVDFKDKLNIVIQVLGDNTIADAGTSDSDEDHFDPDENTVTELLTGVTSIITNRY